MDDDELICYIIIAAILIPSWVGWGIWAARVGLVGDWAVLETAVFLVLFTIAWLPPPVLLVIFAAGAVVGGGYGIFLLLKSVVVWLVHHPGVWVGVLVVFILLVIGALAEWLESRSSRAKSDDPEDACMLCEKCDAIVQNSGLLGRARQRETAEATSATSVERHDDFYDALGMEQSADGCRLCALLWDGYSGPEGVAIEGSDALGLEVEPVPLPGEPGRPRGLSLGLYSKISGRVTGTPLLASRNPIPLNHACDGSSPLAEFGARIDWARKQIETCVRDHDCQYKFSSQKGGQGPFLPKRLIDVRQSDGAEGVIRLVLSEDLRKNIGGDDDDDAAAAAAPRIEYLALSHCWGGTVTAMLTAKNHDAMQTFPAAHLDRNFRDAVVVARRLSVDYLWIDSLCIVQGSAEWEEQSGDMGLIYANALCVISATGSKNSHGGCHLLGDVDGHGCVLAEDGEGYLFIQSLGWTSRLSLRRAFDAEVESGTVTRRGWTFQERFLASRVLHFCPGGVLFECNDLIASQAGGDQKHTHERDQLWHGTKPAPPPSPTRPATRYATKTVTVRVRANAPSTLRPISGRRGGTIKKQKTVRYVANQAELDHYEAEARAWRNRREPEWREPARLGMRRALQFMASFRGKTPAEEAEFHTRWFEMVEHYSERLFTDDRDKLVALAGVASVVQAASRRLAAHEDSDGGGAGILMYAAGLWSISPSPSGGGDDRTSSLLLPLNLLWEVVGRGIRPEARRVPTWSWGSIDGKISHRLKVAVLSERERSSMSTEAVAAASRGSWEALMPLVSNLVVRSLHDVGDTVHSATLCLSCSLYRPRPGSRDANFIYDTSEVLPPEGSAVLCLPVLRFVNQRVHPLSKEPQVHGILVVRIHAGASPGEVAVADGDTGAGSAAECYRRVGYFWTEADKLNRVMSVHADNQRVELV